MQPRKWIAIDAWEAQPPGECIVYRPIGHGGHWDLTCLYFGEVVDNEHWEEQTIGSMVVVSMKRLDGVAEIEARRR